MVSRNFEAILQCLSNHNVRFIVVGALSAVLNGAPMNTFDVDIVHSTDPENVDRLLDALDALDAFYRLQPERRLRPGASHLTSSGHQMLMTKYGPLDVLGHIGRNHTYTDLINHSVELELADGLKIRVLDLETLITVKEEVGGEKDIAALPTLRSVLKEQRREKG